MMIYIGIDISKLTFDVSVLKNNQFQNLNFENNCKGHQSFCQLISTYDDYAICCMEATGIYGLTLAKALYKLNHKVIVANPIKTHGFAKMQMLRNKTDRVDAQSIAQYCKHLDDNGETQNSLFKPKGDCYERLQHLFVRLDQLKKQYTQETNRLHVSMNKTCSKSIKAMIKFIAKQMVMIETEIQNCAHQDDELKEQVSLLTSINGVGDNTAWAILAYLGDINLFKNSRQATSFVGLNPRIEQSGTSVNKSKLAKMGHRRLRKSLYMPAIVACQHNDIAKALYQRLLAKGKPKKTAIAAVMRKLLVIAYGVLKPKTKFEPNYQR